MVRTFLKVYMEFGSYFLFLQEQIKDIIIISFRGARVVQGGEKQCQPFDMFFCARTETGVEPPVADSLSKGERELRGTLAVLQYTNKRHHHHTSMVKTESGGSAF
jgi:hypothetical protein